MANQASVKAVQIPEFFGDSKKDTLSSRAYINQVEACQKLSNWTDEQTASFTLLRFRNNCASWANNQISLDPTAFSTWPKLKKAFSDRFTIKRTLAELAFLKNSLVMTENESVRDFYDRVVSCQLILDEDWEELRADADAAEKTAYERAKKEAHNRGVRLNFTTGVTEEIRKLLVIEKLTTNSDLLEFASRIESSVRDQKRVFNDTKNLEVAATSSSRGKGDKSAQFRGRGRGGVGNAQKNEANTRCFICQSEFHWANKCRNKSRTQFRGRGRGRGFFRGRGGFNQSTRTASVEASHFNTHSEQQGGRTQNSSPYQQQQQENTQNSNNTNTDDPYFHLNQAMVDLNPYMQ